MKHVPVITKYEDLFRQGRFTYVNLYNYIKLRKLIDKFDGVYFDGIGLLIIYYFITFKKVPRYSADNTSLIPLIIEEYDSYIICGGTEEEANYFSKNLLYNKKTYLATSGYQSVHCIAKKINEALNKISPGEKCMILLGLGSPKQEEVALQLKVTPNITVLTVGAYISQFNKNPDYFPKVINKLHLRMPYRLIKENLWSRLPNYFISPFLFVKDRFI